MENVLLSENEMEEKEIEFFKTNRGGDITFHGLQQVVGYPILDLEKFYTDIGKYLRSLEEVIILTIAEYGIKGDRSKGETGVWIEPGIVGKRKKNMCNGHSVQPLDYHAWLRIKCKYRSQLFQQYHSLRHCKQTGYFH